MNRKYAIVSLIVAAFFVLSASAVSARPVKVWTFHELNEKADLVIIGTARSSADTKNYVYPNPKPDTQVSVDTVFDIDQVIKGELETDTLTMRHRRYFDKQAEITTIDGPSFVEFDPRLKNRYLIFLKLGKDGIFEPLTGQFDPDGSFLLLLQPYHISNERKLLNEK